MMIFPIYKHSIACHYEDPRQRRKHKGCMQDVNVTSLAGASTLMNNVKLMSYVQRLRSLLHGLYRLVICVHYKHLAYFSHSQGSERAFRKMCICHNPGGPLVSEVGYHPRKKIHVIRVVFQDQAMYARTSFRGAKTCKIGKKGMFLVILTNFGMDTTLKLRKTHAKTRI